MDQRLGRSSGDQGAAAPAALSTEPVERVHAASWPEGLEEGCRDHHGRDHDRHPGVAQTMFTMWMSRWPQGHEDVSGRSRDCSGPAPPSRRAECPCRATMHKTVDLSVDGLMIPHRVRERITAVEQRKVEQQRAAAHSPGLSPRDRHRPRSPARVRARRRLPHDRRAQQMRAAADNGAGPCRGWGGGLPALPLPQERRRAVTARPDRGPAGRRGRHRVWRRPVAEISPAAAGVPCLLDVLVPVPPEGAVGRVVGDGSQHGVGPPLP
ncbi:hypothetical protein QFZ82_000556 [Streptomyces sp. V4I23]|nr:hypothetical protein [Streptomyces sp. V4I23]